MPDLLSSPLVVGGVLVVVAYVLWILLIMMGGVDATPV